MYAIGFDNPWIRAVDGARRRFPVWLAVALGLVLPWAFILGGGAAATRLAALLAPQIDRQSLGGKFALSALDQILVLGPFLITALLAVAWQGRAARPGLSPLTAAPLGLVLGLGGFCAVVGVLKAFGVIGVGAGSVAGLGLLAGLALFIFQVAAEEVFFRGWLQPILCARMGPGIGLLTTSVLFACAHWAGERWGVVASVNLVLGGLLFGLLALRTGGLWAPLLAHLGWNAAESLGFGLEPNPGLGPFGALVDLDATGSVLWTGGADRLNGSLASTIVLGVLVTALLLVGGKRAAAEPPA